MPLFRKPKSPFHWYDFHFRGKRYRGSTGEKQIGPARAFERDLLNRLEAGEEPHRTAKVPTLREFIPRFLDYVDNHQQRAKSTKRYYHLGVRLLKETMLCDFPIDKITSSSVSTIKFPASPSNGNMALRTLSRILSLAVEWNQIRHVPRIHLYREQGRTMLWTPEYERAFLAVAKQPLKDVFILAMNTGMRPGEIFCLRWEDIDWERKTIHVKRGKTKASTRFIGITDAAEKVLRGRIASGSPFVFAGRKAGTHIEGVSKAFAEARKLGGLPEELKLYCTRHTYATDLVAATGNTSLVARQLGHTSPSMTNRYTHPDTSAVAEIMDAVNAARKERVM